MAFIMALDQGTTSSRAIVFNHEGEIVSAAQKEFRQIFPRPGWVEHDPREIWSTQAGVAVEALEQAGIGEGEVAAVGITNQRETTIVWDRATGAPIYNAIVWQDRRTAPMCNRLRAEGHERLFQDKTGLLPDSYFSGTKIRWILDHVPDARARALRGELAFGTVDSWLVWNLMDGAMHVTDATNASRTLLFNIHTCQWDEELLAILGIPREMLPEIVPSSGVCGEITSSAFAKGVPLAGILGDQQAATLGQACVNPGIAKSTYGTGCFLLMNTGSHARASEHRLLSTIAWEIDGRITYALEGSVFVGGAIVQWLRDGLRIIRDSAEIEALAARVPDNGGVSFVPALTGLGAPHWDPNARGLIAGITRGTTDAHIARAALEGIACEVADLVTAMERDAGHAIPELRADGGAAANNLLMQLQADILGIPVVRPRVLETTALGAAYAAGLATGYWNSLEEIAGNWKVDRRFEPGMEQSRVARIRDQWGRAVERAKAWENEGSD